MNINEEIIAIDGPAGAGKSTVAKLLAAKLDYIYIDTGAMYRSIAYKCLKKDIKSDQEHMIETVMKDTTLDIEKINGDMHVILDNEDVTGFLRTPEVTKLVNLISMSPIVRRYLIQLQRNIAVNGKVVMDGRDIGTVVFPEAKYKFYLTAGISERVRRRKNDFDKSGINLTESEIRKEIIERDENDKNRPISPLIKAKDAIEIDSTGWTIEETVDKILSKIRQR